MLASGHLTDSWDKLLKGERAIKFGRRLGQLPPQQAADSNPHIGI